MESSTPSEDELNLTSTAMSKISLVAIMPYHCYFIKQVFCCVTALFAQGIVHPFSMTVATNKSRIT
ncbi:hypothetical protein DSOL_0909 [Desulfosporosinus metallidurans]|uniref:Uncharacterized protein n=1 Tax=Desulfosporosinus metallidurans TaxID=1888891 RepID=A0A1Q8R0N7_9FIRM|nr:hypothetical protein DSOL_0909 [Desulfosporosinus metallidurans]